MNNYGTSNDNGTRKNWGGTKIVDNLTSTDTNKALSANQGKVLNDKVTALPIKSLTGQTVLAKYNDPPVTAETGATIIGDLRERTYNGSYVTQGNVASGEYSVAIGSKNTASDSYSVAMGDNNIAFGSCSVAMGENNTARSTSAVAMGERSQANGYASVAMGCENIAQGSASHSEGTGTVANGANQHAQGRYNIKDTGDKYAHTVGNGTSDTARSNAHTIDWDGNAWFAGDVEGTKNGTAHNLVKKSEAKTYTVSVPTTDWTSTTSGNSTIYTQTITVTGITATDTPVVDVVLSDTVDTAKKQLEAYGCVSRMTTAENSITIYCYESAPTTAFTIQLLNVTNRQ